MVSETHLDNTHWRLTKIKDGQLGIYGVEYDFGVNSPKFIMSPSSSFRLSGIPWQITSFIDLVQI